MVRAHISALLGFCKRQHPCDYRLNVDQLVENRTSSSELMAFALRNPAAATRIDSAVYEEPLEYCAPFGLTTHGLITRLPETTTDHSLNHGDHSDIPRK